jgi:site-specific recombinase XerD
MRLADSIAEYVAYKRSLGMRFNSEAHILTAFCRDLGDVPMASVTMDDVQAFLDGEIPVSSYWQRKHTALAGLFRFAVARGYIATSPLPFSRPRLPPPLVPYIYSQAELKRLLDATPAACSWRVHFEAYVLRNLILLSYGACLRPSEARHLLMKDVDLDHAVMCIRTSKFYKTRLVPLGKDLNSALRHYVQQRNLTYLNEPEAPLFCFRDGRPLSRSAVASAFRRLRRLAGIIRQDNARYQPRLQDLRHTGAVHRLVAWYHRGADLQRLLPQLSTYLGHVDLSGTQRYLTLTPELLREASLRFERYAMEANHD